MCQSARSEGYTNSRCCSGTNTTAEQPPNHLRGASLPVLVRPLREAAEITAAAESGKPMMVSCVDRLGRRYRRRARPLSARSINMHIDLLAQILAVAVDHGHLESNPAVGKRRRLKASKPPPVHLAARARLQA